MHLGTTSTSRGEGNHHVLKSYLKTPLADLLMVFQRLSLMLENQFVELKQKTEEEKICVAHRHKHPCMRKLLGHVSKFALTKIAEQVERATRDGCTGTFTRVWGLPCKHRLWHMTQNNSVVELSDVHNQWLLTDEVLPPEQLDDLPAQSMSPCSRTVEAIKEKFRMCDVAQSLVLEAEVDEVLRKDVPPFQNPHAVTNKRGRPMGSKNKANKRDKSAFEYAHGNRCSACGQRGHNVRSCPT